MSCDIQFLSKKRMVGYGTTEMRCVQPSQYLTSVGWKTSVGCIYRNFCTSGRVLVLHRVTYDQITNRVIRLARNRGLAIIYDIDDLIFEPNSEDHGERMTNFKCDVKDRGSFIGYREAMMRADIVTTSTEFLRSRTEEFHDNCVVIRNGLSKKFVDFANTHRKVNGEGKKWINIGYFSGSAHHDKDFRIVQPVLLRILNEFDTVRVILGGKLRISEDFHKFGNRFEFLPFVPYSSYPKSLGNIDINLAPLDVESDFAQARSELKYIEAGAFEIPTIASPTQTYKEVIDSGRNGLLCNKGCWFENIARLVTNSNIRYQLGRAAKIDVLRNYTPEARARDWQALLGGYMARVPQKKERYRANVMRLQIALELGFRYLRRRRVCGSEQKCAE